MIKKYTPAADCSSHFIMNIVYDVEQTTDVIPMDPFINTD